MSTIVSFEKGNDVVVGVKYERHTSAVMFEIYSAIDEDTLGGEIGYNLTNETGVVSSFEDALLLASGRVFMSDKPVDIISGNVLNYWIKLTEYTMFKSEFEDLVKIIDKAVVKSGDILAGLKVDEYEFLE